MYIGYKPTKKLSPSAIKQPKNQEYWRIAYTRKNNNNNLKNGYTTTTNYVHSTKNLSSPLIRDTLWHNQLKCMTKGLGSDSKFVDLLSYPSSLLGVTVT